MVSELHRCFRSQGGAKDAYAVDGDGVVLREVYAVRILGSGPPGLKSFPDGALIKLVVSGHLDAGRGGRDTLCEPSDTVYSIH